MGDIAGAWASTLELFQPFRDGLVGLHQGMDLWLLTYRFQEQGPPRTQGPIESLRFHGRFASLSPERPSPVDIQRGRIRAIDYHAGRIHLEGVSLAPGLPVLDLRPGLSLATSSHPEQR